MPQPWCLTSLRLKEEDVILQCLDLLWHKGYYPIRLPVGKFRRLDDDRKVWVGQKGLPDYVVLHERYGGFLLEFKRPGGKLRPSQQKFIWEVRQAYHLRVAVVDSVALLQAWLEDHEKKPGAPQDAPDP